jgi:hypothetical protein
MSCAARRVNYRPEYRHVWGGKTYYRQLRIDPLPPERADELLDALLGPDAALGPLKRLLIDRTEANPLFLEESVRALVEGARLNSQPGAPNLGQGHRRPRGHAPGAAAAAPVGRHGSEPGTSYAPGRMAGPRSTAGLGGRAGQPGCRSRLRGRRRPARIEPGARPPTTAS